MDWMMRSVGYANVALWLAGDDGSFQLGAYMKYTLPGEEPVVKAMQQGMLPMTIHDGVMHITGNELIAKQQDDVCTPLAGNDLLGVNCTYLGDPLAAMLFFRDAAAPFSETDIATVKAIGPVFAATLAALVRDPSEEETGGEERAGGDRDDSEPRPSKQKKRDRDDWWKNGEPPPF